MVCKARPDCPLWESYERHRNEHRAKTQHELEWKQYLRDLRALVEQDNVVHHRHD